MADVYKIGVTLALASNHAQVFQSLTSGLLGIHTKIKDIEKGWGGVHLAVAGTASILAGVGILKGIVAVTDAAKDLSHELVQIQKLGISPKQFDEVRRQAQLVTRSVPGVTQVDALKGFGQAYSMFGFDNAIKLMAPLQRFAQVLGNTSGDFNKASDSLYSMLRSADLMGKFVNHETHQVDIGQVSRFLDLGSKVNLATHGQFGPQQWLGLAQQGGPALSNMSDIGLITMGIAGQAMGGQRAGTALTSLYQQMVGGKMTQFSAEGLKELGLVGDFTVGRGGHLTWAKGALDTDFTKQLREDPLVAVQTMQKAMAAHGMTSPTQQTDELFKILGRQTTQRLVSDLLRNMPQIFGERERIQGAMGISDAAKLQNSKDMEQVLHNLDAAWKDFLSTIGQSDAMISFLNKLTEGIKYLTKTVQEWPPGALEAIGKGIAFTGAILIGAGVTAVIAAIGPAGWIAAGLLYITPAVIGLAKEFPAFIHLLGTELAGAFESLKGAIKSLFDWITGVIGSLKSLLPDPSKTPKGPGTPYGATPPGLEGNPFFQPMAFGGGGISGPAKIIHDGTLAALIDYGKGIGLGGGGGGGGIQKASYNPGGGAGAGNFTSPNGQVWNAASGSGSGAALPNMGIGSPGGQLAYLQHIATAPGRNPNLAGVDSRLKEIVAAAGSHLPSGYRAVVVEGYNAHGHVGASQHHIWGKGALDMLIMGPHGAIPNRGSDPTGLYTRLARSAYGEMLARHPELKGLFAWGGAFGTRTGGNTSDLMHFDIGGERGHIFGRRLSRMGPQPGERYGVVPPSRNAVGRPQSDIHQREHQAYLQVHSHIHLDGKKVAEAVTKRQTKHAWTPRQAPYHDTFGHATSPDIGFEVG